MATYSDSDIRTVKNNPMQATVSMLIDISEDTQVTGAVDLGGWKPVGIISPSVWASADLTFLGSHDDETYKDIYSKAGGIYTVSMATDRYIPLPMADTFSWPSFLKLKSTEEQTSTDKTVILVLERRYR